jgi:L-ascorbate metabolism protein UlaG (beta-lactamase superfamily)
MFTTEQNELKNIDLILITHEHQDHFHLDSLKVVLKNNPSAKIITNSTVGALLEREKIPCSIVEHGGQSTENGVLIEGFGTLHAVMHSSIPQSNNTGYFIANRLFYPGDAFTDPDKPVELLALPAAGPWMKLSEAIDYALLLKPKICFPVHDGMMKSTEFSAMFLSRFLEPKKITICPFEIDKTYEF